MGWIGVVLNDSSGNGDCAAQAKQLEAIFAEAGREARVKVARGGEQIRSFIESAVKDGCEILVAGGGDGTINTAASVLVDRDIPARRPCPSVPSTILPRIWEFRSSWRMPPGWYSRERSAGWIWER